MKHYHVLMGPMGGSMAGNVRYDAYEDSVIDYVKLVREIFSGRYEDDSLNVELVMAHTDYGNSPGIYMGVPQLTILWLSCEEAECNSSAWN